MKLSIFTDELNPDPGRAVQLAAAWQIPYVEVRSLPSGRFPQVSDAELENFHRLVVDAGLAVSGVSPGFFKGPVGDPQVSRLLTEGLSRACEWAQRWGTSQISCFGFQRDDSPVVPAEVIDRLGQMAEICRQQGCRLTLENEAGCWGNTGLEAAAIVRQVNVDNFALLWDPGNSARAGSPCPYPDEYDQFREMVAHVHLKNFDPQTGQWSLLEQGVVDWPGQLAALQADGYEGFLVIETHRRISPDEFVAVDRDLEALEVNSRRNLDFVRSLGIG